MYRLLTGLKSQVIVLLLLLLAGAGTLRAQGDIIHSYRFETGVDSTRWLQLGNPTVLTGGGTSVNFGFDFLIFDNFYNHAMLDVYGVLSFSGVYNVSAGMAVNYDARAIYPAGTATRTGPYAQVSGSLVQFQRIYEPDGTSILVFQSHAPLLFDPYFRDWQVQLRESDFSITLVYAPHADTLSSPSYFGMRDNGNYYVINTRNQTVQDNLPIFGIDNWPGPWRYYRFTPLSTCPKVQQLEVGRVLDVSARAAWAADNYSRHLVICDTVGGAFDHDTLVFGTSCNLTGLLPEHDYEVRVRTLCDNGDTSLAATAQFRTICPITEHGINYADLYSPNVVCRYGSFSAPSTHTGVLDYGSASSNSRHTLHYDAGERDIRTLGRLAVVPHNHCVSVRLGNWLVGAEQEEVSYSVRVDTNQFDLLILRYALVEEQPNHPPAQQPRFELSITDSVDQLISNCYYGNFISGDNSGWQNGESGVVWRDWDAVGIDLTPLHGQLVHIKLSNYDCAAFGHFGYAYFVLDTEIKSIRTKNCGDMDQNTFYAPEGFTYRWYSAANPFRTLSTTDSLMVNQPGRYFCDCTYNLSGQSCGFTLSTDAFSRWPMAAYTSVMLDTCGARRQFVNQSVVVRDVDRTDISDEPCESYLWDFGDGTTSTETDPTHCFGDGNFQVTLYAMLSGGQCTDSITQTIHAHVEYDTVWDTICYGESRLFHGREFDQDGLYSYNETCHGDRLALRVWPLYDYHYYDTAVLGTPYAFGTEQYDRPGVYRQQLSSLAQCDSVQTLHLSSIEDRDSLACLWDMPLIWWGCRFQDEGADTLRLRAAAGTDSLVALHLALRRPVMPEMELESTCVRPSHYTVTLPDSLRYTWRSVPSDPALDQSDARHASTLRIKPPVPTMYYVEADYPDAPSCPMTDSLFLDPPDSVWVRLLADPAEVTDEFPGFRVLDADSSARRHKWYVEGVPQTEGSDIFFGIYPPGADSLRVTAIGYNGPCADTAEIWIRRLRQELYFPNIFTPDLPTNNRFLGVGVGVKEYELRLFTKWGDQIFQTNDILQGWDGTRNGQRCPADAYVYRCTYTSLSGRRQAVTGTVVLVR